MAIFVTDIKVVEANEDKLELFLCSNNLQSVMLPINEEPWKVELKKEQIIGAKYLNHDGKEVCIGMSKKVQEALGLPLYCFEELKLENTHLKTVVNNLEKKLKKISKLNPQLMMNVDKND